MIISITSSTRDATSLAIVRWNPAHIRQYLMSTAYGVHADIHVDLRKINQQAM